MQSGDIDIAQIGHGAHSLCIGGDAVVFQFDQLSQADAVVVDKSRVASAEELAGKTVGVSSGTSSEIILQYVLRDAGLTMDDINPQYLSFAESATAFQDGQIDAAFLTSGVPNTAIVEITTKSPVRVLAPTEDEWTFLNDNYAYYVPYTIPAGTYEGMTEDAVVPAVMATLIVSKDLDADLVYDLTKVLFEKTNDLTHAKKAEISAEAAVNGVPTPFHPGAARYYAELGLEVLVGE